MAMGRGVANGVWPINSSAAAASRSSCTRTAATPSGISGKRATRWSPIRKMALTVPGLDTATIRRCCHCGNCSATRVRTISGVTANWPGCICTAAALHAPLLSTTRFSGSVTPTRRLRESDRQSVVYVVAEVQIGVGVGAGRRHLVPADHRAPGVGTRPTETQAQQENREQINNRWSSQIPRLDRWRP